MTIIVRGMLGPLLITAGYESATATGGPMPLNCYGAVLQSLDSDPLGVDADQAVQTG